MTFGGISGLCATCGSPIGLICAGYLLASIKALQSLSGGPTAE